MADSKISFSYEGIGRLLRSVGMETEMIKRAERIKQAAEARAPVYSGPGRDEHRGRYKASFRIESSLRGGDRHDRAEATVLNDSPEAIFVERGHRAYGNIPAQEGQHILAQAMMAAAGDE